MTLRGFWLLCTKLSAKHGVDNLSEEEIEAEIKAARAERKKRLGTNG